MQFAKFESTFFEFENFELLALCRKKVKKAGGGMTAKGVAKYRRDNPGSKLKTAVTTPPSKLTDG